MQPVSSRLSRRRASWVAAATLVVFAASCETSDPPPRVASVSITPTAPTIVVGTTQQLSATAHAANGDVLEGRTGTWSPQDPAIATVSATGLVTGVAPGGTQISYAVEGVTQSVLVTVIPVPVASVLVTPGLDTLEQMETVQLSALARDAGGATLAGRTIVWSSRDTFVVKVSATGLVTAAGVGSAIIDATSETKVGSATIVVKPSASAPTITSISPTAMVPGAAATLTGTGFSATLANNAVTVHGISATVTAASATELSIVVPCVPSGLRRVKVAVQGLESAPYEHDVAGAQRALAVGEVTYFEDAAAMACAEIAFAATPSRYVAAVYSIATSPTILADFSLNGNPPVAGEPLPIVAGASVRAAPSLTAADREAAARDAAHTARLQENARIYADLMPRARRQPDAALSVAAELPALGTLRVFNYRFSGGCVTPTDFVAARAVYVGTRAIIWEDTLNTVKSATTPIYLQALQRIGQKYDAEQHDVVAQYFGDPLRRDLDADGRVHMIFTQRVNSIAAAFVTGCDQFSPVDAPSSNYGEFFYGSVPTNTAPNLNSTASPDGWAAFMIRTVVHEVKHIASMAARVANGSAVWELGWLEEGSARHAEEVWYRAHTAPGAWKSNIGWGTAASNGVYCDFHLTDATCNANAAHRPSWGVRRQFNELRPRLIDPWNWSPFGDGSGQTGAVFYQVSWHLIRYATDRYGTTETGFLTDLIQATTNGTTNLTARSGVSLTRLLGGWGLAMYLDDAVATPHPDIDLPTWNTRGIYAGLNASPNWSGTFTSPFLMQATMLPSGSFAVAQTGVRGGGHVFYEITGTANGRQLLLVRGFGGGAPPPDLRLAVVRIQ